VLYITDGQAVFNWMHLDRVCEELIRRGEIEPLIVVAITEPSWPVRVLELTPPWPDGYDPGGGGGLLCLQAIRDTLEPKVDRLYRTLPGTASTAIGGMSLGGLLAAYAGFAFDSTFGSVAAFSPSYWWGDTTSIYEFAQNRGRPENLQRFYQDTGYPEDNWIGSMEQLLISLGFVPGQDLISITVPGAEHVDAAWEHRFPQMLRFLFPRSAQPEAAGAAHSELMTSPKRATPCRPPAPVAPAR